MKDSPPYDNIHVNSSPAAKPLSNPDSEAQTAIAYCSSPVIST